MATKWLVIKDQSHWLVVVDAEVAGGSISYEAATKERGTAACAKWDGCVHLVLNGDYLHICDVNDLIARLVELRDMARARGFEGYDGCD